MKPNDTFCYILRVYEKHRPGSAKKADAAFLPTELPRKVYPGLQEVHRWRDEDGRCAHAPIGPATTTPSSFNNDPSAGSPTETLLRLLLPLNDQV